MKKIILRIEGMTCSACSSGLEKYLNKQDGIMNASVNLVLGNALIEYEDNLTIDDLNRFIKEAGFTMAFMGGRMKVRVGTNKYKVPRYGIVNTTTISDLKSIIY